MLDRVYWLIPGEVLTFELSGVITLQDVKSISDEIQAKIETESQSPYIDILLDVNHVTRYHPETLNIKKSVGTAKKHPRARWTIIINPHPNPVVDFVVRTVCQIFKTQLTIIPTRDAALAFIQTKQPSKQA
jgi:hypothetical protein